jgi:hypothetical protein
MPKDTDNTDSPDLLNALESIKGLLEQSESKLSAARESLKKAKTPDIKKESVVRPPVSSEPVVPVLDDIVETFTENTAEEEPSLLDEVPVLENFLEPEEATLSEPEQVLPLPGHSTDEVLAYIDHLQLQLEQELTDTLTRTVVDIEAELKKTVETEFQKLKEQLAQTDND